MSNGIGTLCAIILGSGRGRRRLDGAKSLPLPLIPSVKDKPVLDWILAAFHETDVLDPVFVGGYHVEKVVEHCPELRFLYHKSWNEEGEAAALQLARYDPAKAVVIVRADTVIVPAAITALVAAAAPIAVGFHGAHRRFVGALVVSAAAASGFWSRAKVLADANPAASLNDVIAGLTGVDWIDLTGLATPVDDSEALFETIFAGKGRTLEQLATVARSAVVLDQVRFSTLQWMQSQHELISAIQSRFSSARLIIRSSTRGEDRYWNTAAGVFHSELDVVTQDADAIARGVSRVIDSYGRNGRSVDPHDEVLVQPQLESIQAAGVLFTRDPNSGAPYFVLNIESRSGRGNVVTSGCEGVIETAYISWLASTDQMRDSERQAVELARELMSLTSVDSLDIEFGIGADGKCYLFQVRPLPVARNSRIDLDSDLQLMLEEGTRFVEVRAAPFPTLLGSRAVFGNMPDWNPAEMIGVTPRPLALSLYQSLIGTRAWSEGRATMGYRDAGPHPLVLAIAGRPYVDVRASLNSFLPGGIRDDIGTRWIDHCIEHLCAHPELHDKIEFEVTVTCSSLNLAGDERILARGGLSVDDIRHFTSALQQLTASVLNRHAQTRSGNLGAIHSLKTFIERVGVSRPTSPTEAGYRVALLLDECRSKGIVPFVVAARKAFVAVRLLRSLVEVGVLDEDEVDTIQRSVQTVATNLLQDLALLSARELEMETFLGRYGHLRPGSYDITAPNYASRLNEVLKARSAARSAPANPIDALALIRSKWRHINRLSGRNGLEFASPDHFVSFISDCISDRELVKLEFMRGVDVMLESVAEFGRFFGLDRDALSFLQISEVARYGHDSASGATGDLLLKSIAYRRKRSELSEALHVPDLIKSSDDLFVTRPRPGTPNFVTRKRIEAPIAFLDDGSVTAPLCGKIVAARAADPGYDWIFGQGIAGLVTEYGGMASHMAIRAAEFGIPAAIGCGTVIYALLKGAKVVELDAANRLVRRVL